VRIAGAVEVMLGGDFAALILVEQGGFGWMDLRGEGAQAVLFLGFLWGLFGVISGR